MSGTPLGPGSVLAGRFRLDVLLDGPERAGLWRATDRVLARNVAVHVLPDTDPRAGALLTAARTSALVSDVRLLRVLDAAAEDGLVYVVNEWGSGASLDRLLADGPVAPRRAAWVVREVAEAIATAHRNGVAHGRLVPENVMVTDAGSVKVIGFVIDEVLNGRPDFTHHRVTGGEPLDSFAADVVNLGALLYAALVQRWPGTEGSRLPAA
ncbi:MAG: protein kinase family protein, partial [Nocardioidaceae bacterium]